LIHRKDIILFLLTIALCFALFLWSLSSGTIKIAFAEIWRLLFSRELSTYELLVQDRLLRTTNAFFSGGTLAVVGLILQSFFRNALAGPGVLGISNGASFGVAIAIFIPLGTFSGFLAQYVFGLMGAFLILFFLLAINRWVRGVTLLVVGLMISFFSSAFVMMLLNQSSDTEMRKYVEWGFGSFGIIYHDFFWYYIILLVIGLLAVFIFFPKILNIWVLGELMTNEAGYKTRSIRRLVLVVLGILVALITVHCGPIAFLGIATPQVTRLFIRSTNHSILLPVTLFLGGALAIFADVLLRISVLNIPLNGILALFGAPIIIYVILKSSKKNVFVA
jgi:iron complex transport system permease protein